MIASHLNFKQAIKENKMLIPFLILIGILAALKPNYLTIDTLLLFLIYFLIFRTRSFFISLVFLLFIQQSLIKTYYRFGLSVRESMIISRADEIIWITLFIIILFKIKEYKEEIEFEGIDFTVLFLLLFSFFSLFINHRSLLWGSISILLMLKGYLIYLIGDKLKFQEKEIKKFITLYLVSLFLIGIIGIMQFFDIHPPVFPPDYRFGLKVINSIFGKHTTYGSIMVIGATLVISFIIVYKNMKLLPLLILFIVAIILSSLRRSLISLLIVLFVLPFITKEVSKKIYIPFLIIIFFIFLLFRTQLSILFTSTIQEYVRNFQQTPRGELYIGMVKILKSKILFGEGPGSFAGQISKVTVSNVYKKYGLSENVLLYSSDAYPAHIFGELGLGGGILYIMFMYYVFRKISKMYNYFINIKNDFFISLSIYLKLIFIIAIIECFVSSFVEVTIKSFALFGILSLISSFYRYSKSSES